MNPRTEAKRWPVVVAILLVTVAVLMAAAGLLSALFAWAIMFTYADDQPNTWLQNATPLIVYILPSWICASLLVTAARRLRRSSQRPH